jgi:hypothetical protein
MNLDDCAMRLVFALSFLCEWFCDANLINLNSQQSLAPPFFKILHLDVS